MATDVKPLAVRLDSQQRARLDILARLTGRTVTDLIREAVDGHLATLTSDPAVAAQAEALAARIQQDAVDQQAALVGLFGTAPSTPNTTKAPAKTRSKPTDS